MLRFEGQTDNHEQLSGEIYDQELSTMTDSNIGYDGPEA